MAFEVYKRGQGRYTRLGTLLSGMLIGVLAGQYVWKELQGADLSAYLVYGVPVAIMLGVSALMAWVVNHPRNADFMIATEGEMKKVSWSTRREVVGGTKVVIATTLILALLLWAVDIAFGLFFKWIGVIKLGAGN